MVERDFNQSGRYEIGILSCMSNGHVYSLSELRRQIEQGGHVCKEDREIVSYPSGKQQPLFWTAIGNSMTPPRKGNLLDKGFVERLGKDQYRITKEGLEQHETYKEMGKYWDEMKQNNLPKV